MKKVRIPTNSGDEWDVFSKARRYYLYTQRPGVCKKIKKKYNKRLRKALKKELK